MDTFSIPSLAQDLKTEGDAYLFLEDLRWQGRPVEKMPEDGSIPKSVQTLTRNPSATNTPTTKTPRTQTSSKPR